MDLEFMNACEEAKNRLIKDGYMPYITEIVDIGDRWLFFGEIDDKDGADYGNNPVSVTKKTGNVNDFYLGDIENYKLYENGADVEIPKEYLEIKR